MDNKADEYENESTTYGSPSAIASYLKSFFGIHPKVTKRSLSEEAECGSPDSVSEWLRKGSNPNEIDAYGYTPLVNASLRGCKKSVSVLISNGADINQKAIHGYTPLHAAAQNGHLNVVELLIQNGADMEARNDDGDTALILAVRSEHANIVDLLCKKGSDLHALGFDKIDPINYAMNKRNLYMSDVLLKHERQHLNSTSSTASISDANNSSFNSNTLIQPSSESIFTSD